MARISGGSALQPFPVENVSPRMRGHRLREKAKQLARAEKILAPWRAVVDEDDDRPLADWVRRDGRGR